MALRKRALEILSVSAILVLGFLIVAHHFWPRVAAIGGVILAFAVPGTGLILALRAILTDRKP